MPSLRFLFYCSNRVSPPHSIGFLDLRIGFLDLRKISLQFCTQLLIALFRNSLSLAMLGKGKISTLALPHHLHAEVNVALIVRAKATKLDLQSLSKIERSGNRPFCIYYAAVLAGP